MDIGLGGAGLAGLLSFLSPCILPIVPFYLCYIAGVSFETLTGGGAGRRTTYWTTVFSAILFSLGVTTIFVMMGASATLVGQQFRDWSEIIRYVAAGLIILIGLNFLGAVRIGMLFREARFDAGDRRLGLVGAFLIGMAFAFGWTPCAGPIVGLILFVASQSESAMRGALLLFAYGIGMTLPFIVAAVFIGPFLAWAGKFRRHLGLVEKVMGGILVGFGVLIATDSMNVIAGWMLEIAPDIGTLGSLE